MYQRRASLARILRLDGVEAQAAVGLAAAAGDSAPVPHDGPAVEPARAAQRALDVDPCARDLVLVDEVRIGALVVVADARAQDRGDRAHRSEERRVGKEC